MLLLRIRKTTRDRHVLEDKGTTKRYMATGVGLVPENLDTFCEKARLQIPKVEISKD